MKKTLTLAALLTLAATPAFGSGYRIPEQSINSVALSNAYVAATNGADTSYYNPARMSWMENRWHDELSFTYINLSSIEYTDDTTAAYNSDSKSEDFLLPQLHLVSPEYGRFRFGFSAVYPYGLSKQWRDPFPRTSAEEFTLKVYEFNPTFSCQINDKLAIGGGVRVLYSDGKVKSHGLVPAVGSVMTRDLAGDTTEYGYNLALAYQPTQSLSIAATYRSKVNLEIEGDARLYQNGVLGYSGYAEVMVPAPAVLTLGAAYTWNRTTLEFNYDKTYWSAYDKLDFNYAYPLGGALKAVFDDPKAKNWVNTDAFRFGVTHRCTDKLTAMVGFAIDKNPIPDSTLGFELPDSDAKIYSIGFRYQKDDRLTLGVAYLYDDKESRHVSNSSISGTFDKSAAQLLTVGLRYRF